LKILENPKLLINQYQKNNQQWAIFQKLSLTFIYLFVIRSLGYLVINNLSIEDIDYKLSLKEVEILKKNFFIENLLNLNINSLGILPCLNAGIIMQLLTSRVNYFEELAKSNSLKGRETIEYWNRFIIFILSIIGSIYYFSYTWPYIKNLSLSWIVDDFFKLSCGTFINLLIADKITTFRLGSGISVILLYNLLSNFEISKLLETSQINAYSFVAKFLIITSVFVFSVMLITIQEAEKKVIINFDNELKLKQRSSFSTIKTSFGYLPLKINPSGVLTLIVLTVLIQITKNISAVPSNTLNIINNGGVELLKILSIISIVTLFNLTFANQKLKTEDLVENLKTQNAFLTGIRPGKKTQDKINLTLFNTTLIGTTLLTVALFTLIKLENSLSLNITQGLSGNLILILTGVTLDLSKRIYTESSVFNYEEIKF